MDESLYHRLRSSRVSPIPTSSASCIIVKVLVLYMYLYLTYPPSQDTSGHNLHHRSEGPEEDQGEENKARKVRR